MPKFWRSHANDTFEEIYPYKEASHVAAVVKNTPVNARDSRDMGLTPGSGRSPGGGHGNPLQYPCLKNPMGRGAWLQFIGSQRIRHEWSDLACTQLFASSFLQKLLRTWACNLPLMWWALWTEPFTCRIWCCLWIDLFRMELSSQTPTWIAQLSFPLAPNA